MSKLNTIRALSFTVHAGFVVVMLGGCAVEMGDQAPTDEYGTESEAEDVRTTQQTLTEDSFTVPPGWTMACWAHCEAECVDDGGCKYVDIKKHGLICLPVCNDDEEPVGSSAMDGSSKEPAY